MNWKVQPVENKKFTGEKEQGYIPLTPEQKAERNAETRENLAKDMIAAAKDGKAPWQQLDEVAKIGIPMNPVMEVSGPGFEHFRNFKGMNALVLMKSAMDKGYTSNAWIPQKDASEQGYFIKKGEKATFIEISTKFTKEPRIDPETGEKKNVTVELEKPMKVFVPVYNVQQFSNSEKIPVPGKAPMDIAKSMGIAERIIKNSTIEIDHSLDKGGIPYYNGPKDVIKMPPKESFEKKEEYYAEVLHQIAHATGHPDRMNRSTYKASGQSPNSAKEALSGEIASFFVALETGLKTDNAHQKSHEWAKDVVMTELENSPNGMFLFANNAGRMASGVMGLQLDREQEQEKAKAPEQIREQTQEQEQKTKQPEQRNEPELTREQWAKAEMARRKAVEHGGR